MREVHVSFSYFFCPTKGNSSMPWKEKLQAQWNENPIQVIAIAAFAATATAKLVDAMSAARGRRAYARQIDYKIRNKK
jgi:hypothetical protein